MTLRTIEKYKEYVELNDLLLKHKCSNSSEEIMVSEERVRKDVNGL